MRKHNGMRPQDIVVLLKIISFGDQKWQQSDLAQNLKISVSEISESLNRSKLARLVDTDKKRVNRLNVLDFIEHGLQYVFPIQPGSLVRGLATGHSHPFMKSKIKASTDYVWPDASGNSLGLAIEPFYAKQSEAAKNDEGLYLMLALLDVIRVGRNRERVLAIGELKKRISDE